VISKTTSDETLQHCQITRFVPLPLCKGCGKSGKDKPRPVSLDMSDFAARRVMMVDTQVRPSDVTKYPIIEAMLSVQRENFVPVEKREAAYMGDNMVLGGDRVILAARTFAKLLDAVSIQSHETVLDIGCCLGYSSAVIGRLARSVTALEQDLGMADAARRNLEQAVSRNVTVVSSPMTHGAAQHGPYDVILVQGGVEQIPDSLLSQLALGGRIGVIVMEKALGVAKVGLKSDAGVSWRFSFNATAPVLTGFTKNRAFAL
jgi:protein-L-isoaspartate(D-aspartate) O-methyltransferase